MLTPEGLLIKDVLTLFFWLGLASYGLIHLLNDIHRIVNRYFYALPSEIYISELRGDQFRQWEE